MAVTCKHCRRPLYTNMFGYCRSCGKSASLLRTFRAPQTVTRRGAIRVARRRGHLPSQPSRLRVRLGGDTAPVTWQEAEMTAELWMRRHGHRDARMTGAGPDGGVDVRGRRVVAQVKHHARPVSIAEVQRLSGIARSEKKQAMFFALSGYTPAALGWAHANDVRCFVYPPVRQVR